ncbi:MAG: hypothetical protein GY801_31540 [bacterium]|nr:hypothetical protein [bacterium]
MTTIKRMAHGFRNFVHFQST